MSFSKSESKSMDTQIQTIGAAIIFQNVIKYAAYIAMTWIVLSFADVWIMAWLAQ